MESQNKGHTKFQSFLQRVEEKNRENVRKELEKRDKRIQSKEMSRAAAASSGEPKTNDATARHLVASEKEATARRDEGCLVVRSGHGPQAEVAQGVGPEPLVEH